jgi:hypothetical protein
MQRSKSSPSPFALAWLLMVVALCAVVGLWMSQISALLGPLPEPVAAAPHATAPANIVTDYTRDRTASADSLCAELSPRSATVVVETPTGVVLSTLHCSTGITPPGVSGIIPPEPCVYSESPDGDTIVMSATDGSVLSRTQAANCTK